MSKAHSWKAGYRLVSDVIAAKQQVICCIIIDKPKAKAFGGMTVSQHAGLNSIVSEINIRKLLFLGHQWNEPLKITFVIKSLFQSRATSHFDKNIMSVGVLPRICDTLWKYNLFTCFETWFHNSVFLCYEEWKSIVYCEVCNSEMNKWTEYCVSHSNLHLAKACMNNIPP